MISQNVSIIKRHILLLSGISAIFLLYFVDFYDYGFFYFFFQFLAVSLVINYFLKIWIFGNYFNKSYSLLFRDLKQSQERYESLVEYSPETIGVYTNDEFVFMNSAGLRLFGAETLKDIIGKKTLSFIHPEYRDSIRQYVQKMRRGEKAEPLKEFRIIRLDGDIRYVEAISSEIIYEGKKSTQIVVRDITERKRKEEELIRTNDFNQTLLNTIPFAMDIVDVKGNILFVSKKLEKKFSNEIIGKKCWEIYKDNQKQCLECPLKQGIKIGKTASVEIQGVFGEKIFKVTHTGINFKKKIAIMEIFRDITEQKSVEKVIQDARIYAESIVNTVREPLVVLDKNLRIVSANWAFYYTFRFLRENSEGKLFYEIYNNYWHIPVLKENLERVIKNNIPVHNLEVSHIFTEIGQRIIIFNARRIYQVNKKSQRFLLSIKDITEKKRSEEQLRQSEEKYRNIFDNASDAIVTIDLEDKITSWNRGAERIFGWSKKEVIRKNFLNLMVPEKLKSERKDQIIKNVYLKKEINGFETIRLRKDGSEINVSIMSSPIVNAKNEVIGLSSIIRDITKQKEIDKAKTEFVSIASHELRTPLANMSLSVEMILDSIAGPLNPELRKYLRGIYRDIKGMASLVDALLNVSRIELRTMIVAPEPASLNEVAEYVIKEVTPQVNKKNLKVKKIFDPALPIINFDRNLMRIILQNLLTNAIKYTPNGGEISIEIKQDKNNALIKVSDNGCGIPKDQQGKIFQKLFRARNAVDRGIEGVGLGLYIVKSIVVQCGGKIWIESEENKGTDFFVEIPLEEIKKISV